MRETPSSRNIELGVGPAHCTFQRHNGKQRPPGSAMAPDQVPVVTCDRSIVAALLRSLRRSYSRRREFLSRVRVGNRLRDELGANPSSSSAPTTNGFARIRRRQLSERQRRAAAQGAPAAQPRPAAGAPHRHTARPPATTLSCAAPSSHSKPWRGVSNNSQPRNASSAVRSNCSPASSLPSSSSGPASGRSWPPKYCSLGHTTGRITSEAAVAPPRRRSADPRRQPAPPPFSKGLARAFSDATGSQVDWIP